MAKQVATPWGSATVVDEVSLNQRVGEKRFASIIQLLAGAKGERFVRFTYATDGVGRRGPVTLRTRDLGRLRDALRDHPELADALRLGGEA
jgi:hypothetical protein